MEWNRRNVIVALVILVIGFGGGGAMFVHQVGWFQGGPEFAWFRLQKWVDGWDGEMTAMTLAEEREAKKKVERIAEIVLKKYPALRIEEDEVPRERNGFYAMIELAEDTRIESLRQAEVLYGFREEFDADRLRKEIAAFEGIGAEIERVAAMPERSSWEIPDAYHLLTWSAGVKAMHDYLVLQACLAVAEKDESEAFRYLSLAGNLNDHLGSIAKANFLSETVFIVMELDVLDAIFDQVLPSLGEPVDLERWRQLVVPRENVPQRYADLIRGEFWYFQQNFAFSVFDEVPDPVETLYAYAAWNDSAISELKKMDFEEFARFGEIPHEPYTKGISEEGTGLLEIIWSGKSGWDPGYLRAHLTMLRATAAFDLLTRERAGEDLSVLTETYVLNPKTGKPFAYDASTRTLEGIPDTEAGSVEALKLPW